MDSDQSGTLQGKILPRTTSRREISILVCAACALFISVPSWRRSFHLKDTESFCYGATSSDTSDWLKVLLVVNPRVPNAV